MNGYTSKYLYYKSNKNSLITIPRPIIEANNLNWKHTTSFGKNVKKYFLHIYSRYTK